MTMTHVELLLLKLQTNEEDLTYSKLAKFPAPDGNNGNPPESLVGTWETLTSQAPNFTVPIGLPKAAEDAALNAAMTGIAADLDGTYTIVLEEGIPSRWSEESKNWDPLLPGCVYPVHNGDSGHNTIFFVAIQTPS